MRRDFEDIKFIERNKKVSAKLVFNEFVLKNY